MNMKETTRGRLFAIGASLALIAAADALWPGRPFTATWCAAMSIAFGAGAIFYDGE